jgi:large subunit ribosomal protein L22
MEAKATARYVRMTPRKTRVIIDMVRGKYVDEALEALRFTNRRATEPVTKVLSSAVANAKESFGAQASNLYVAEAYVNEGPTLRRYLPRAMGRATRIDKRTSHITVIVKERD